MKMVWEQTPIHQNIHAIKSRLFLHPFTSLFKDRVILTLQFHFVKQEISDIGLPHIQTRHLMCFLLAFQ